MKSLAESVQGTFKMMHPFNSQPLIMTFVRNGEPLDDSDKIKSVLPLTEFQVYVTKKRLTLLLPMTV